MQLEAIQVSRDDSDIDQGFVLNTLEIKHRDAPKMVLTSKARPIDYEARYITTNTFMRKEPSELVCSFPHFAKDDQQQSDKTSRKRPKEQFIQIQQQSFPNKNYQLVYQRFHKKNDQQSVNSGIAFRYLENNVTLASVVSYSAQNYSVLKNWQIKNESPDLIFQSRFECGNLLSAYKNLINPNHYALFIQNDTNTKGYNKWYYFAVTNAKKNTTYTFSIVNFRKKIDFIKEGMKPTRFSSQEHKKSGNGWSKCGNNIRLYKSKFGGDSDLVFNDYYTLSFEVTFEYDKDVSFFSLLPPYSYTRMMHFLTGMQIATSQRKDIRFSYSTISYSLSNTQVPYVTISSDEPSKKNILILARQHPGEVWSSFLVQSLMKQLLRDSFAERQWLLKNFTFRIFPMVNVDGVIYGNFRCDLSGMDLNRCWKQPNKLIHPHIVAIKEEIMRLSKSQQIVSCFDLHSHSKDYNIFAYCCKTDNNGRLLPYIISRMSNIFCFSNCTYGISKYKETTARAIIYDITKALDVLTIESSFFASDNPLKTINPASFITFSMSMLKALKHYYSKDKQFMEAEENLPKAMAQIATLRMKNKQKYKLEEQSGSDSQPECDQIAISQKIGKILPQCPIVEIALGIKKQEKLQVIKQALTSRKQKKPISRMPKLSSNTISEQSAHKKVEKPPLLTTRTNANNDVNKNLLIKVLRKKQQQISLDKKQINEYPKNDKRNYSYYHQKLNQSVEMQASKNLAAKNHAQYKSIFNQKEITKYEMHYQYEKKEQQEFPLLCVLSDRQKDLHLNKLQRINPFPIQKEKPIIRYQPTLVINKKLDTMQKLRERQKKSSDLVSSLWKQTIKHDKDEFMGSIFYSGL